MTQGLTLVRVLGSTPQKGLMFMGKDKAGETARQDHKHDYEGSVTQDGDYVVVHCSCGVVRDRVFNPGGNR